MLKERNSLQHRIRSPNFSEVGPYYSPPKSDWLKSKCTQLGITYVTAPIHPGVYEGHVLIPVIPLADLPIERNCNCLFRAFSAILTGSQSNYANIHP